MRLLTAVLCSFIFSANVMAQSAFLENGNVELGARFTRNILLPKDHMGFGVGGQLKFRITDHFGIEGYFDFSTIDIGGVGTKSVQQTGFSVLYFPLASKKVSPYFLGGYNYTYESVLPASYLFIDRTDDRIKNGRSGVHFGLGGQYYLSDKVSLNLTGQYVLLFGDDLRYELQETPFGPYLSTNLPTETVIKPQNMFSLILSLNYKIVNLKKS